MSSTTAVFVVNSRLVQRFVRMVNAQVVTHVSTKAASDAALACTPRRFPLTEAVLRLDLSRSAVPAQVLLRGSTEGARPLSAPHRRNHRPRYARRSHELRAKGESMTPLRVAVLLLGCFVLLSVSALAQSEPFTIGMRDACDPGTFSSPINAAGPGT